MVLDVAQLDLDLQEGLGEAACPGVACPVPTPAHTLLLLPCFQTQLSPGFSYKQPPCTPEVVCSQSLQRSRPATPSVAEAGTVPQPQTDYNKSPETLPIKNLCLADLRPRLGGRVPCPSPAPGPQSLLCPPPGPFPY